MVLDTVKQNIFAGGYFRGFSILDVFRAFKFRGFDIGRIIDIEATVSTALISRHLNFADFWLPRKPRN